VGHLREVSDFIQTGVVDGPILPHCSEGEALCTMHNGIAAPRQSV